VTLGGHAQGHPGRSRTGYGTIDEAGEGRSRNRYGNRLAAVQLKRLVHCLNGMFDKKILLYGCSTPGGIECEIPLRDCGVFTIEQNDGDLDLLLSADDTYLPSQFQSEVMQKPPELALASPVGHGGSELGFRIALMKLSRARVSDAR
jgi:hypothetical protein